MKFDKLKESCVKIKMPSDMKKRITDNCNAAEAPEAPEKPQRRLDGRLLAACACCFLLLLGIGLTYSGIFEKKPPVVSEMTDFSETSEESKLSEILSTAKSTAAQIFETTKDNISESKTDGEAQQEVESTVSESTEEFTTAPFIFPNDENVADTGSDDNLSYVRPMYLEMRNKREDLIKAKEAAETMSEEEYERFLAKNHDLLAGGYFHSLNAGEYLEFTKREWYIPVVPEEAAEVYWMDYTPAYKNIDMGLSFSETSRIRFDINESCKADYYYKDSYRYRYKKTIQRDNVTIKIYSRRWLYRFEDFAWKGYGMDITVDGQEMSAITTDMPLDELEKYIDLIEFVTIKDWLS